MFDWLGGPSAKVGVAVSRHLCSFDGGSICQVWYSGIQNVYAWLTGGPSAKFGVLVIKTSMVDWGGHSANFGVVVFKACMFDWLGCPYAKFGVVVFKTSMLHWQGVHLPSLVYWYSRHLWLIDRGFNCQVWCNSIQGIYAWLKGVNLPILV